MRLQNLSLIPLGILPAVSIMPAEAVAIQYLTVEQAQKIMFPEARDFEPLDLQLSEKDRDSIDDLADSELDDARLEVWKVKNEGGLLGHFIVNEVIGKHELITYAVGILPDNSVTAVEILDYRESQGGQIRDNAWRHQFTGKGLKDNLVLGEDIKNISGATYSCKHITSGVRRLLALYQVKLKP